MTSPPPLAALASPRFLTSISGVLGFCASDVFCSPLAPEPTPETAVREAGKQDSKSKANSANVDAIAASGEQRTSLAQKPRTPGIEVKKRGDVRAANGGGDRTVVGRSSSAATSLISSRAGMRLIRVESLPLRQ